VPLGFVGALEDDFVEVRVPVTRLFGVTKGLVSVADSGVGTNWPGLNAWCVMVATDEPLCSWDFGRSSTGYMAGGKDAAGEEEEAEVGVDTFCSVLLVVTSHWRSLLLSTCSGRLEHESVLLSRPSSMC
jgi:hypothetical protein